MNEYRDTRVAVMGLLAELAKTTPDPVVARQFKTSRSIHMLANSCSIPQVGFKGRDRDRWLASHAAA